MKKDLQKLVTEAFDDSKSAKDVIAEVKDYSVKNNLTEQEIVSIVSFKQKTCFIDLDWIPRFDANLLSFSSV